MYRLENNQIKEHLRFETIVDLLQMAKEAAEKGDDQRVLRLVDKVHTQILVRLYER